MWTTPPSAPPSSAGYWRRRGTGWPSWPSPTGGSSPPSPIWAAPGTGSSSTGETSTPWWPIIPPPGSGATTMPTPLATGRACGRTGPPLSTPTRSGRPLGTSPLSSGGWRPPCAGSPTTITGRTRSGAPSSWTPKPTCSPMAWGSGPPGSWPLSWPPAHRQQRSPR